MKLIVGLGNPGKKYKNNRHNVGHLFVDYSIKELTDSKINKFQLYKTDCYMNESGKFVQKLFTSHQPLTTNHLYIIHDDLDIPLGRFKIQKGTGPLLHNGIESVENSLRTKDFWRIRIGVDNRQETGDVDGESYVLKDFSKNEKELLLESVFPKILTRLKTDFSL